MKLQLTFTQAGDVSGEGADPGGRFQITGIFSRENDRVIFTKVYDWQSVDYTGLWDGMMIYGKWTLHDEEYGEQGEFEIWPDKDESEALSLAHSIGSKMTQAD